MTTKVFIFPQFKGVDRADGGIRRVVEAQTRWLPNYGIELVEDPQEAAVLALHAGTWVENVQEGQSIVAHCHGLYWTGYAWSNWARDLNKDVIRTMRQADVITGPSEWVCQALRRNLNRPAINLHHGIEPEDWPASTSDSDAHGYYILWNKTRVDSICDPEPVNKLALLTDQQFVTTYGTATSNVSVTGIMPHSKAKQAVQNAGVYLATSRETFGIGTLEAMAAGVPVLGWAWGGQTEFVLHREHGYLAKPDDYDDLLAGLDYCIKNRRKLGKAARKYVLANYTNQERVKPYADLYKGLAGDAQVGRTHRVKISVVITNYNLGRYLTDAVKSVLNGSLSKSQVELVVVDDASTEPIPEEVIDLAADINNNITLIQNNTNQYLSEALNTGIQYAIGRYILPLDADNLLAPDALKILSEALDKDPGLDIAYGKMQVMSESGTFVSDWPPAEAQLTQQLLHRNQISSTAMYRKRVWDAVGGYRRRCNTAEDADFWTRALCSGAVGRRVTDAVTLVYRDRSDSMSHVQKDWAWHKWYSYAIQPELRLPVAGGTDIHTHEFPWVSVVIPVGPGHERLVLDALDSLQNQTLVNWEALVINDTGYNNIQGLPAWARVKQTHGTKPAGASTARNIGIVEAKGAYVLFLDADDYLHPECLRHMYETITESKGFVYSDWFVAETGEYKTAPDFNPDDVLRQLPYPVTCMYSLKDLRDNQIKFCEDLNHKGWEDWDFSLQVIAKVGICGTRIEAPLFHYRLKSGTLREKAYADREQMKEWVFNKWGKYISKQETNMASGCGCGGGRSLASYGFGSTAPNTQADPSLGPTVQLEYLTPEDGPRSFIGRVTGNRYKFGSDSDHLIRTVYEEDAPGLISLGIFRQVGSVSSASVVFEPLAAVGPPAQSSVGAAA